MRKVFLAILGIAIAASVSFAQQKTDLYKDAVEQYIKGNFHKAEQLLKEYVKEVPDAEAYYLLGYCLYKQKRFQEASRFFKEAYLIEPDFSPTTASYLKKKAK